MAAEFIAFGAQGRNKGQDTALVLADGNGVDFKFRANSTTKAMEILKNGVVVGQVGASSYGTVTQITDRTTGVTLSTMSGAITTHAASLAAEISAVFTVTNTLVKVTDVVVVSIRSGTIALNTDVIVKDIADGSFKITVVNGNAGGGAAETGAIIINFQILRQPTAALAQ